MRKVIAIVFMLLLTAQMVQVTLNFSQSSYAFSLDEEQKEKVSKAEGKEIKELITSFFVAASLADPGTLAATFFLTDRLNKPHLDRPTPPPNYSC
jgi:hypothetical protein